MNSHRFVDACPGPFDHDPICPGRVVGRQVAGGLPEGADTTVVMLDGRPRFDHLDPDLTIYLHGANTSVGRATAQAASTTASIRRRRTGRGWRSRALPRGLMRLPAAFAPDLAATRAGCATVLLVSFEFRALQ